MTSEFLEKSKLQTLIVIFAIIILILNIALWFWGKNLIEKSINNVQIESEATIETFHKEIGVAVKKSVEGVTKKLADKSNAIVAESLSGYQEQLLTLKKNISTTTSELERLRKTTDLASKGLPELIELDDLRKYYAKKLDNKDKYSYSSVESFDTSKGKINFSISDFDFEIVPSTNELAWIRIGKKNSSLNAELIKAWIIDSRDVKKKFGYKQIYKKTKPADYGQYTEVLLKKGDMYFKTYYQFQRVQGTYDRHSLQYTFYVEIGSKTRKEKAKLERFNRSLGS